MSDEPKKHRLIHPTVRLVLLMLGCAWVGAIFAQRIGNFQDFWIYAAPYPQALEGAVIGLFVELFYFRILDLLRPPTYRG